MITMSAFREMGLRMSRKCEAEQKKNRARPQSNRGIAFVNQRVIVVQRYRFILTTQPVSDVVIVILRYRFLNNAAGF